MWGAFNPVLFIRGLSCPHCVQTSLTQNCLQPTTSWYPYNLLPVLVGTLALKKPRSLLLLGPSCPLQTILLSDLLTQMWQPNADSMAVWCAFIYFKHVKQTLLSSRGFHTLPSKFQLKSVQNSHYYLQWTVSPSENISCIVFKGRENFWAQNTWIWKG